MASITDLIEAIELSRQKRLSLIPIGQGSNIVLRKDLDAVVVCIKLQGRSVEGDMVHVAAGESWHDFVAWTLEQNLYGLENLALIPGTVGAAPIQNIGAYGVELNNFVESVSVLDSESLTEYDIAAEDCVFSYRSSRFQTEPNLIVTAVRFKLNRVPDLVLTYPGIQASLDGDGLDASPQTLFATVCQIRAAKLPDPTKQPNVGSFFKNPVIEVDRVSDLLVHFPELPVFPVDEGESMKKLSAAWLIDQAGLKLKRVGDFQVSDQHALVIINEGNGQPDDLMTLVSEVQAEVQNKFGVVLEPEPGFLPSI